MFSRFYGVVVLCIASGLSYTLVQNWNYLEQLHQSVALCFVITFFSLAAGLLTRGKYGLQYPAYAATLGMLIILFFAWSRKLTQSLGI